MRVYLCKLPEGLDWYPVRAWGPEQAAEDFALMWLGPRLGHAQTRVASRGPQKELLEVELAYQGRFAADGPGVTVLVQVGEGAFTP